MSSRSTSPALESAIVIGVSATDTSDQVTDCSIHGEHIDVAAPGQDVLTTFLDNGDCLVGTDAPDRGSRAGGTPPRSGPQAAPRLSTLEDPRAERRQALVWWVFLGGWLRRADAGAAPPGRAGGVRITGPLSGG